MDTCSFIVYIKTDDIYKDIAKDVEMKFETADYESERTLPKEKKGYWFNERWIRISIGTWEHEVRQEEELGVEKKKVQDKWMQRKDLC